MSYFNKNPGAFATGITVNTNSNLLFFVFAFTFVQEK